MAKKKKDGAGSTIENRVYLFKDLAAAFVAEHGAMLASANGAERQRALRALGDLAHASCVVADTEARSADEVAELVANGPPGGAIAAPRPTGGARKTAKRAPKKRRGWGGGRGGG